MTIDLDQWEKEAMKAPEIGCTGLGRQIRLREYILRLIAEIRKRDEWLKKKDEKFRDIKSHTIQKGHCVMIEELCDDALAIGEDSK